jgi:hypothetical protein
MYYIILTDRERSFYYSTNSSRVGINKAHHFSEEKFKINYPLMGGWVFIKILDDGAKVEIPNR